MRQAIGEKKIKKLREITGLPIVEASVRGNNGHWMILTMDSGAQYGYHPVTKELRFDNPGICYQFQDRNGEWQSLSMNPSTGELMTDEEYLSRYSHLKIK